MLTNRFAHFWFWIWHGRIPNHRRGQPNYVFFQHVRNKNICVYYYDDQH